MKKRNERTQSYYSAAIKRVSEVLTELREIVQTDCPQTKLLGQIAIDDTTALLRRLHSLKQASPN